MSIDVQRLNRVIDVKRIVAAKVAEMAEGEQAEAARADLAEATAAIRSGDLEAAMNATLRARARVA